MKQFHKSNKQKMNKIMIQRMSDAIAYAANWINWRFFVCIFVYLMNHSLQIVLF